VIQYMWLNSVMSHISELTLWISEFPLLYLA